MYVNLNKAVNLCIYCSNNEVEVNKMHHVNKQLDEPLRTYRQRAESHLAYVYQPAGYRWAAEHEHDITRLSSAKRNLFNS